MDLHKYLHNDILTLQVDANLLCMNRSVESSSAASGDILRQQMKKALDDNMFCDLTIECGGKEFKVHRIMLASQSQVFKTLLLETDTSREGVLQLPDEDPEVLAHALAFIYMHW